MQIILSVIPKEEKGGWHYPTVKHLFALIIGISSECDGDK